MKKLFIITGEYSGDIHASHVVSELKKIYPDVIIEGIGGENLKNAGVKLFADHKKMSAVGISPAIIWTHFQLGKKVTDEYTRALQFVRFQKTVDNIYFAILEPLYNILPLTIDHFRNRFSDQQWIIYDVKRKYGIYYDCNTIHEVTFSDTTLLNLQQILSTPENLAQNELLLQTLWKSYFKTICIKERLNPRKQKKDMPVRYWKYLTEKY